MGSIRIRYFYEKKYSDNVFFLRDNGINIIQNLTKVSIIPNYLRVQGTKAKSQIH